MDILPFNFNENKIRTYIDENNEIWFIAQDVLKILLDSKKPNVGEATKDLDIDEKKSIILNDGNKGNPNILIISESGLYALIMRSRKPIAKPFQKWVTKEILPSIRKTGKYELKNYQPTQAPQQTNNFNFAEETQTNKEILEFIELITSQNPKNLFFLDKIYKSLNKNSPLDLLQINLNSYYFIPTELGKFLNKSAVEINKILEHKGFQFKKDGEWFLTEKGQNFGFEFQNGSFKTIKWKLESLI